MKSIIYEVPLVKQGLQECLQASITQLLNYYGNNKAIKQVKQQIPVYISKESKPLGTSIGHAAAYLIKEGFNSALHVVDTEIFDRSWNNLNNKDLVRNLKKRRKFVKHHKYNDNTLDFIFNGYVSFLNAGGTIEFPIINKSYLLQLLKNAPFIAIVNYNFLNTSPKQIYDKEKNKFMNDSIRGFSGTHSVVIAGYKDKRFLIVDPDRKFGGKRWINSGHLLGSIYLAEIDYDSLLITANPD